MNTPVGYTCRIEMYERQDIPCTPLLIRNSHFASLVATVTKKCDENQLFLTDCATRLHSSAIFQTNDPFSLSDDDDSGSNSLPENVYKHIHAF